MKAGWSPTLLRDSQPSAVHPRLHRLIAGSVTLGKRLVFGSEEKTRRFQDLVAQNQIASDAAGEFASAGGSNFWS